MPSTRTKLCCARTPPSGGEFAFEFNLLLSKRGTDWQVYKNSWDAAEASGESPYDKFFKDSDSDYVKGVITALMADNTGVSRVSVEPYRLIVTASRATDEQTIIDVINNVAEDLGLV
jgi:hypothetical protein